VAGVGGVVARVLRSRAWRANIRVGQARGGILAAGIAFFGVFSLFPLLVLGFAAAGLVIGGNQRLQDTIVDFATQALPGVIGDGRQGGGQRGDDALVSAQELLTQATDTTVLGLSAVLGVGALLFTGLGWIAALREGIRGMFEMPVMALDPVRAKLFDLAVLLTLGSLIVASALVSIITQTFTEELLRLVGLEGSQVGNLVTGTLAFLILLALNTVLFSMLYRVLARSRAPYRAVVGGAALAAFGVVLLQVLVGVLLGNAAGGFGFLTAFVPILALFIWLNLNARVMLLGAAWVAVGPSPAAEAERVEAEVEADVEAEVDDANRRPAAKLPPVLPERWTDRTVLGAGVVLGASAFALAHLAGGAARTAGAGLRSLLRSDDRGPDDRSSDD